MRLRSLLLAALTLAASAGAGAATDYYVAPLGKVLTCTAAGTQACPWASIWDAINSGKFVGGIGDKDQLLALCILRVAWLSNALFVSSPRSECGRIARSELDAKKGPQRGQSNFSP